MSAPASFLEATPCEICGHRSIAHESNLCERCTRARAADPSALPRLKVLRPVDWEGPDAHPLAAEAVNKLMVGQGRAHRVRVSRTFLVVNYYREGMFGECLDQLRKQAKPTDTIRAFHGTDRRSAGAIAATGFDMRFAGRHGQAHGPGVYFSTAANYSQNYSPEDAGGAACMFYTEIATGRVDRFDSANPAKNDSVHTGSIRVAFRAQQTLPLVLIFYEAAK